MANSNSAITPHQLSRRRRRNIKKAIKRKRRRYDAAFWGKVSTSYETVAFLGMLTPEQSAGLNSGSMRDRKRVVQELNIQVAWMKADPRKPNPVPTDSIQPKPTLKPQTHEFVQKGSGWGLRRREGFKLW